MNQILFNLNKNSITNNKNKKKYIIILTICIIITIICIMLYLFSNYYSSKKEKISKNLASNFSISTLYSNSLDYNTTKISSETSNSNSEPFVIGLIKIDKINLTYPILSTTTEDLLKISPCRFYGPMPNEIGNLCIAGHNYVDNKFFSKIYLLDFDDLIKIYDLNGNSIDYKIYNKFEVQYDDLSCTNQNTNGYKEITLITCNNLKGTRIIVKAKEIL